MYLMSFNQYFGRINSPDDKGLHCFAASNTYLGFKSYFGGIFSPDEHNRIYILKGGPGIGKSTLMKQAGSHAEKLGLTPVYYHCSSDPYSLDGIVIKQTGCVILDGTAPHTVDPSAAGVKEIIINMGECWDTGALYNSGKEILSLIKQKSSCYSAAYKFLSAQKQIKDCLCDISRSCLLYGKISADVDRKAAKLFRKCSRPSDVRVRITAANSCDGDIRFRTFEKLSDRIYFIKDLRYTGEVYMRMMYNAAIKNGIETVVSYDPTDPGEIDALYFPEISVCFTPYDDDYCIELEKRGIGYSVVNMRRFTDTKTFSLNRSYYRFGEKCASQMHAQALSCLNDAGLIHRKIEKLYAPATDYTKVSAMTESLMQRIFDK